ncbi:MAG: type II toxin-antitoxin system Phd/YefM family antitoxin [Rhizomicrobium sp.]|jgi:antitoxin Phd
MRTWALQDAKARFSEVVRAAKKEPQTITLRGEEAAVVVSADEYHRLKGQPRRIKPKSLLEALRACPSEFEIPARSKDRGRVVEL